MAGSKHDSDCQRRKTLPGLLFLCTCDLTEDEFERYLDQVRRIQERKNRAVD